MRITYDASVDAAYIHLSSHISLPETRSIDDDINLDFNEGEQLVGIEVLDASKRLPLDELKPLIEQLDEEWDTLTKELRRLKESGETISVSRTKYRIEEIGWSHVMLKNERTGEPRKATAMSLLGPRPKDPLLSTLWKIGAYKDRSVKVS